jgi:predicted DNA-binding transcriptional regulator YafY
MRADRLLAILLLLQANGRLPARTLAERLEVSKRTIDRDMEALAIAGVPVYAERGRLGGWALTESYRTDLTGLTESELRSLVVASAPTILADLGLSEAAGRALLKVLASIPDARRREAESARQYLHVDPGGWRRTEEVAPFVPALDAGLRAGRRIRLTYERATDGSTVERTLDPLGLVAKGSVWYLVASVDGGERTYRVSRIRSVELLDAPAVRPPGFDLAEYWGRSREEFEASLPSFVYVVRIAPEALPMVRGGWWRYARLIDESEPGPEGWVRCTVRADTIEVAQAHVLGLGPLADVIEPAELKERVLAAARAVARRTDEQLRESRGRAAVRGLGRPRAGPQDPG